MPVAQCLDGLGIGFPTSHEVNPELVAQMLTKHGLRPEWGEVGWGNIKLIDATKLDNASALSHIQAACRRWRCLTAPRPRPRRGGVPRGSC